MDKYSYTHQVKFMFSISLLLLHKFFKNANLADRLEAFYDSTP